MFLGAFPAFLLYSFLHSRFSIFAIQLPTGLDLYLTKNFCVNYVVSLKRVFDNGFNILINAINFNIFTHVLVKTGATYNVFLSSQMQVYIYPKHH